MKVIRYIILLFTVVLAACGGDPLGDAYADFQGEYSWVRTGTNRDAWTHDELTPADVGYTAGVTINDAGEITFLTDGNALGIYRFQVVDRETNDGGSMVMIKLKGDLGDLHLDDKRLTLRLSNDTSLTIDRFPFPAIDDASAYQPDYNSVGNGFVRR